MNNEFLWRNQMRKQAEAVEPEHDLWPAIAARLATPAASSHRRSRRSQIGWFAIAATLVVAGGAGLTAWRWQHAARVPAPVAVTEVHADAGQPGATDRSHTSTSRSTWMGPPAAPAISSASAITSSRGLMCRASRGTTVMPWSAARRL